MAQTIISVASEYFCFSHANQLNVFLPGMVLIGSSISLMDDLILEPIRKTAIKMSLPESAQAVRNPTAYLGQHTSSLGAITQTITFTTLQELQI